MSLSGKTALVTGASSGIGRAVALELAKLGCRVGITARRGELLATLQAEIAESGGLCAAVTADISNRSEAVNALRELSGKLGPCDYLIANAGVSYPTTIEPFNVEENERMFRINFLGVLYSIEAVLPSMLQRRSGHIVGVASLAGYKGLPGSAGYCASKAALKTYLEGLRIPLSRSNIRVTTVCPGFIDTPMTDGLPNLPFLMTAEESARIIVRAMRRRYVQFDFPWQTALLVKAARWLPDWVLMKLFPPEAEAPRGSGPQVIRPTLPLPTSRKSQKAVESSSS